MPTPTARNDEQQANNSAVPLAHKPIAAFTHIVFGGFFPPAPMRGFVLRGGSANVPETPRGRINTNHSLGLAPREA